MIMPYYNKSCDELDFGGEMEWSGYPWSGLLQVSFS